MGRRRAVAAALAIALLGDLLLIVLALTNPPVTNPKHSIDELGRYAVDMTWPGRLDEDMDLWCTDPKGNVAWFNSRDAGFLSLQHDDLGNLSDPTGDNHERLIVRAIVAGEYVCNVHVYRKRGGRATPVTVTLTRLAGDDTVLYARTLSMRAQGDEQTAFRFTLDRQGRLRGTSTLSKPIVYDTGRAP